MTNPSDLEELKRLLEDRDTPLHPDLEDFMEDTGLSIGKVLKHPLVFQVPYYNAALANKQLEWKREAIAEAMEKQDWMQVVWLHERPYRIDVLMDFADQMDDKTYWDVVGAIWTDSENIWQNDEFWRDLWTSDRPGREHAMEDDDVMVLGNMPETIKVYRGCIAEQNEDGLSWTTQFQTAEWFAKRFAELREGDPIVLCGEVSKDDVLAFTMGRNEAEIIVLPENVKVTLIRNLA